MGFRLFVLLKALGLRGRLVSWADCSVGVQFCPTPPRRPAVRSVRPARGMSGFWNRQIEHVHHVTQVARVVREVEWVDVPEQIESIVFDGEEYQACEILVFDVVRVLDRCDLASPLLVLAHIRSIFEENNFDVRNTGFSILGARERRRVGDAVVIVSIRGIAFFRFILGIEVADSETFGMTTLSSARVSCAFAFSLLEVWVVLVEGFYKW